MMGAGNSGAEANAVEGYRLGPAGEIYRPADAWARKKIEELEQKIAELEARPKIWKGTEAEHAKAFEKGEVRIDDFVIIEKDTAGGDEGEGTDTGGTGTDAGDAGADTGDTGTETGSTGTDAGTGAAQEGGMPETGPDGGQES